MATALAHAPAPVPARGGPDPGLHVARPVDALDLDAAVAAAFRPHALARAEDARLADVVSLDAHRTRRRAASRVRRNRTVAVLVALGLAVLLALGLGSLPGAGADAGAPAPTGVSVVVSPGETLWDVASDATQPGQDVRVTMQRIRELNGLTGDAVPAWTTVVLPAR